MDRIEELANALTRWPGIGPRQAKRFVYHLLAASATERAKLSELIARIGNDVHQCPECMRYANGNGPLCAYCADSARDDTLLTVVEKDQDLAALERAGTYRGRYFVLGGVLALSGKGAIRETDLKRVIDLRLARGLKEIVLALSATTEGEHTSDKVRELIAPYRDRIRVSILGRGLATGSELEYSDAETLRAALTNRHEA